MDNNGEPSFIDVANLVLRQSRLLVYCALGGAAIFAIGAFVAPQIYVAHTAFIQADPQRTTLAGGLGGVASRFGVGGFSLGGGATNSLEFLQQAVTSRDVLDSVLLHSLAVDREPAFRASVEANDSVDLISWLRVHDNTPAKRLDHVRRLVFKRMTVNADPQSGIVRVEIGLRDPYVAAAFLRQLLNALNDFNLHTRQTTSRANRVFLEGRVTDAKTQLADAESTLRQFYEKNRRIADSPELFFEESRLKRQVDLAQQIYVTLSQDLEQARIDEVKDTPVLTVVETAQPPVRRSSPKRTLLTVMGAFVGIVVGFLSTAVARHLRRAALVGSPAWREFQHHLNRVPGGARLTRRLLSSGYEGSE
jgi:uncharacterized protein involved in exopolysaccharide biosynthesis